MARNVEQVLIAGNSGFTSVDDLIKAMNVKSIGSLADIQALAVDLFESDEELDEFLEFYRAERQRDLS